MEIPDFSFTLGYFIFLLSVTLTTLGLLFIGGIMKRFKRRRSSFRKRLVFFPVFVAGIFFAGWLTERLQQGVFQYLKRNVATSFAGLVIALAIAWLLYEWVVWRR